MHISVETYPANKTSAKRMAIMLVLSFLGSQLNVAGAAFAMLATFVLGSGNLEIGIALAVPTFLLLSACFLTLSLYPERGRRQMAAGFLGAIVWIICYIPSGVSGIAPSVVVGEVGIAIAVALSLLVSGRIKAWPDLAGMLLGLLIGVGFCNTNLYPKSSFSFGFSPIWLSAVFLPELFSRRAGWRAALIGVILWAGLTAVSALIKHTWGW